MFNSLPEPEPIKTMANKRGTLPLYSAYGIGELTSGASGQLFKKMPSHLPYNSFPWSRTVYNLYKPQMHEYFSKACCNIFNLDQLLFLRNNSCWKNRKYMYCLNAKFDFHLSVSFIKKSRGKTGILEDGFDFFEFLSEVLAASCVNRQVFLKGWGLEDFRKIHLGFKLFIVPLGIFFKSIPDAIDNNCMS
jgi:hypothetical protein